MTGESFDPRDACPDSRGDAILGLDLSSVAFPKRVCKRIDEFRDNLQSSMMIGPTGE